MADVSLLLISAAAPKQEHKQNPFNLAKQRETPIMRSLMISSFVVARSDDRMPIIVLKLVLVTPGLSCLLVDPTLWGL